MKLVVVKIIFEVLLVPNTGELRYSNECVFGRPADIASPVWSSICKVYAG